MKICNRCNLEKNINQFYKKNSNLQLQEFLSKS